MARYSNSSYSFNLSEEQLAERYKPFLGRPNLWIYSREAATFAAIFDRLDGRAEELACLIAEEHPDWRVTVDTSRGFIMCFPPWSPHRSCGIVEVLSHQYGVDCRRLRNARKRGNATYRTDISKAAQLVTDNFTRQTMQEAAVAGGKWLDSWVRDRANAATSETYKALEPLRGDLVQWLAAGELCLPDNIVASPARKQLIQTHTDSQPILQLALAQRRHITIREDAYYVLEEDREYRADTLPDRYKIRLAMLKLAKELTPVPGAGIWGDLDDAAHFILTED
jgi:hypothetical protein